MRFIRDPFYELEKRLREKSPLIQIVMGPRQVGKTTGVLDLRKQIKNLHFLSADDQLGADSEWLAIEWKKAIEAQENKVFVVDEIQQIPDWSRTIKGLWDKSLRHGIKPKVVLLGSSSLSLQEGIEESLAGRFELILTPHWSLEESQKIHNFTVEDYLSYGGYPGSYAYLRNYERWTDFIQKSIVNSVLLKDLTRFKHVRKPALLKQCFDLACSYPAQVLSYKKMLGQLQEGGNVEIVKNYLSLLEAAFLIKCIHKYTGSKLSQITSSPKLIPLAPALISLQLGLYNERRPEERGFSFEAQVGAELNKLRGDLYYWRSENQNEVDYVWKYQARTYAIEVKSTRKKNHPGLAEFCRSYPKAIPIEITENDFEAFSHNPESYLKKHQ